MSIQTMEKNTKSKKKKSLDFSKEQYIKWYKDMLVMRKVEERVGHLYIQQKFGGFCHLIHRTGGHCCRYSFCMSKRR